MNHKNYALVVLCTIALSASSALAAPQEDKPYKGSLQLEKMKTLVGTWKGTSTMDADKPVTVEYKISSAGSSVIETLFPGSPQEMVSVYHDEGGKLGMTHYCALRNQPHLSLRKNAGDKIDLVYSRGENIDVSKDAHMHAVKITFPEKGKMVQNWTQFEAGKSKEIHTVTFTKLP